jgi:VIT1/CCC1 family predicted Fe2+/Mn2+ transporter
LSYIAGGIIPLSPYFFIDDSSIALKYSVIATLICLFAFGYFKSKITGVSPLTGALKVMAIGAGCSCSGFRCSKTI